MFRILLGLMTFVLASTNCYSADIEVDCSTIKDQKKRLTCYDQQSNRAKSPQGSGVPAKVNLDAEISKEYLTRLHILFSQCETKAFIERMNLKVIPGYSLDAVLPDLGGCTSGAQEDTMDGLEQEVSHLSDKPDMATALKDYNIIWQSIMQNNYFVTSTDPVYEKRLGDAKARLEDQKIRLTTGLRLIL